MVHLAWGAVSENQPVNSWRLEVSFFQSSTAVEIELSRPPE